MNEEGFVEVDLPSESTVHLCEEKRTKRATRWILLVPFYSLMFTITLGVITAGALLTASCALHSEYNMPCIQIHQNILNRSEEGLLPASSFMILHVGENDLQLKHKSPLSGNSYSIIVILTSSNNTCLMDSTAISDHWFSPNDSGAGFCALLYLSQSKNASITKVTDSSCTLCKESDCRHHTNGL